MIAAIDLKSYSLAKTNQEIIENAGTQINAKTSEYMSKQVKHLGSINGKSILKFVAEAKHILTLENYIHSKYFDKSSEYYETNLTDTERRIAYNYEDRCAGQEKINGKTIQDSFSETKLLTATRRFSG